MLVASDLATWICLLIIASVGSAETEEKLNRSRQGEISDESEKTTLAHLNDSVRNVTFTSTRSSPTTSILLSTPLTKHNLTVENLVEQFNSYRHVDILLRIRQCHSNMKLNDLCERYAIDNRTNLLTRLSLTPFRSLDHLADMLIDRGIVQKLAKLCSPARWCLNDLSQDDVNLTTTFIEEHSRSLCSLEACHQHLLTFTNTCPSLTNQNVSIATLKLLPLLCALDQHRKTWKQSACMESIVYVLHLLYAFWPELEICYRHVIHGSNACSPACQAFDDIFHRMENQCADHASFLTQVPTIAWYRSIDLKQHCAEQNNSSRPALITSMQNFFTSNNVWHQFHEKPIYAASFILIVACFVISLSLCFYLRTKQRRLNATNRRLHDDYEYTRLHNTSFELGTGTEISNPDNAVSDESQMDPLDSHLSISEYQRLLHLEP